MQAHSNSYYIVELRIKKSVRTAHNKTHRQRVSVKMLESTLLPNDSTHTHTCKKKISVVFVRFGIFETIHMNEELNFNFDLC